ncbi:MAG: NAD(P)H-binding protein [Betaproteobacteria bacterium]
MTARRVFVLGATGTIGQAVVRALVHQGDEVVCLVRPGHAARAASTPSPLIGAQLREGLATDAASLREHGLRGERFDALISCLASRTGAPADAWAIDHRAHSQALPIAREAGIGHIIQLSAICVQRPLLAFQQAKLAFERELMASGLRYSIVRPTAFFKSLSGQVDRVRAGKPYLIFGDGALTRCKPISDADLAQYMVRCLHDPAMHDRILPIGGPGPAVTPRQQGEMLFEKLGQPPRFRSVPVGLLDAIVAGLRIAGRIAPRLRDKAELARIGRYYATESMLVLDPDTGQYDEQATPSTGTDTLGQFFQAIISGRIAPPDRREHAVF